MQHEEDTPTTVLRSGLLVWLRTLLVMIAVLTLARRNLLTSEPQIADSLAHEFRAFCQVAE